MNKRTKNNGITLISLVITIIIMLILVGVSITLAVNGGLFEYAGNAVGDTKNAIAEENEIGNGGLEVDGEKYGSINEYLYGKPIEGHDGEMFSPIYKETTKITSTENGKTYTAWIPKGFAVGTSEEISKISTGLVIRDAEGNEFVWIPVEKAIITESELAEIEKDYSKSGVEAVAEYANDKKIYPMAVQVGENYKGILYSFSGTDTLTVTVYDWTDTDSMRWEPANLSEDYDNSSNLGLDWKTETFQKAYNKMVKSVAENDGFYVGRYEISRGTYTLEDGSTVTYAQSQKYKTALVSTTWYNMYKDESNYAKYNSDLGVVSEMIWGAQLDQVLIFVNSKKDGENNNYYIIKPGPRDLDEQYTLTGENSKDQVCNIFDIGSNYMELAQDSSYNTGKYRISHGGYNGHANFPANAYYGWEADRQVRLCFFKMFAVYPMKYN